MRVNLDGEVAIVTGGANGIGRAIAGQLAENGAGVVIVDIDAEAAERAASEVAAAGARCTSLAGDVSDAGRMEQVVAEVVARFGKINVLVNNAGIGTYHRVPIHEYPPADWQRIL